MDLLGLDAPANIIRVVGTNGKGTVSTMLATGLVSQGAVTGRFLSPHVESFSERVAVGDREVSPTQVSDFVARARAALASRDLPEDLRPAFFELTLALALTVFAEAGVSHAVLEAGVGGAGDATTAAVRTDPGGSTNLRLVVLTNVDLDHTETLGRSVRAIATEKAGAFVGGVPAVTGAHGEALAAAGEVAAAVGSPLYVDDGRDPLFALPAAPLEGPSAAPGQGQRVLPRPGSVRFANARLAAAGLRLLGASEGAVSAAVAAPTLPARGERFQVDGREVVLDGAHDPAAAARLMADLGRRYVLLFGSLARKQGAATLAVLEIAATAVVVTAAEPCDDLTRFAAAGESKSAGAGYPSVAGSTGPSSRPRELIADPAVALERALSITPAGGLLLIAGSLYLAGSLRPLLHSRTA